MKKVVSILAIIALLSALVAVPAYAAPRITEVTDDDLNPITGGVYDERVYVSGDGVSAGLEVSLYWDSLKAWDGEKGLLNSTEAEASGEFEIWFEVPMVVGGVHYLWIEDENGMRWGGSSEPLSDFTVDASVTVNPKSGLEGYSITLKGYGFDDYSDIDVTFDGSPLSTSPSVPVTDELGYWEATFNVPDKPDGDYLVVAEDEQHNTASVLFKVGPSISLDVEEGPVGTLVEVRGWGFTESGTVDSVTLDGIDCGIRDTDDLDIQSDGDVNFELIIPGVSSGDRTYVLEVEDDGGKSAAIDFHVTELATIELDPQFGPPGSRVDVHGSHFAAISGSDVVIEISGTQKTLDTNSKGEISGSITIPAIPSGNYVVEATQDYYNIEASESFRVGTMIVLLEPETGPTGTRVALNGLGFTPGGDWEAYLDDVLIFEDEDVSGDTTISGTFYVPTIEEGTYTVTVVDTEEDIEVKADFTVTGTTELTFDPSSAPVGFNVSVEGLYFAESDDAINVDFLLSNSTDEWNMYVREGTKAVETDEDGGFTAWWVVPEDLSIGSYTVDATDEEGLHAQVSLQIISKYLSMAPSKPAYERDETVRFDIESSFQETGSYIMIWDADGDFVWQTDDLNTWIKVDVTYVAPFWAQTAGGNPLILDSDAPLGTWAWTWYDSDDEVLASGGFLVEPSDDGGGDDGVSDIIIEQLQDDLQDLEDDMSALSSQLQSALASLQALSEDTADSLDELESQVEDAVDDAAESKEDAQSAQALASEAKTTAEGAATTASEAKTTADLARDEVEEALAEAERALKAARGQSLMVYAALGLALVAIAMVFIGPIRLSRAP